MPLTTLKSRADFNRMRSGRKWTATGFVLQAMHRGDNGETPPRFGFTVSSKALMLRGGDGPAKRPGAVLRNRARRRLKEAARLVAPLYAKPGYDYVLIGRLEALHQRFADLLQDLQLAFGKVHRPLPGNERSAHPRRGRAAAAGETQRETEET